MASRADDWDDLSGYELIMGTGHASQLTYRKGKGGVKKKKPLGFWVPEQKPLACEKHPTYDGSKAPKARNCPACRRLRNAVRR